MSCGMTLVVSPPEHDLFSDNYTIENIIFDEHNKEEDHPETMLDPGANYHRSQLCQQAAFTVFQDYVQVR